MAAGAGGGEAGRDRASRRQFLRVVGRQTVTSAGSVLAGVEALRQSSQEALDELVSGADQPERAAAADVPRSAVELPSGLNGAPAYRSPFRFIGGALEILDQTQLPERAAVVECHAASEVASAMRRGLLSGGPALGQLAAYTIAMVAAAEPADVHARRAAVDAAADTLRAARPTSRALLAAIERMLTRARLVAPPERSAAERAPDALPAALLDEADTIAAEAAHDHARLGQLGARALADLGAAAADEGRPLNLLLHGDHGALAGGQIGPGVAIVQSLLADGVALQLWLTDGAPLYEGRRLAWQLEQLDIAHTLVPDTALGWLLDNRTVDALLVRAEWLAAEGDLLAPIGSLAAARLGRAAGVTVLACAPLSLYDPATADLRAAPTELRLPAADPAGGARIDPATDRLPAELIDLLMTDEGAVPAPFGEPLRRAAAARAQRHAVHPGGR